MVAVALACALILGVTGAVEAGVVSTAPLFIDGPAGDDGSCEVANPGTKPVNINIDVRDANGALVATSGPFTLSAGTSARLAFAAPTETRYHCTVDTNNTAIRVAINRFSGTSSDLNGFGQVARSGGAITTAPLYVIGASGETVSCQVVNVSPDPVGAQLEIFDSAGNLEESVSAMLGAGHSTSVEFNPDDDDQYRCVVATPASGVRVSFTRYIQAANDSDLNGYGEVR